MAYPAFAVYRAEMFPTGNRGWANGLVTTTALLSGSLGIVLVGVLRDHGARYGTVMAALAAGQLLSAVLAYRYYPESAHLDSSSSIPEGRPSSGRVKRDGPRRNRDLTSHARSWPCPQPWWVTSQERGVSAAVLRV
jgi:MFS family permease